MKHVELSNQINTNKIDISECWLDKNTIGNLMASKPTIFRGLNTVPKCTLGGTE